MGTTRTLLTAACLILFATALATATGFADCAAVRSSCINHCQDNKTNQAPFQAFANR
jgi:hypothetical protein